MKISRRDFVHGGCTVVASTLVSTIIGKAQAGINNPGSASVVTPNANRVTVNMTTIGYMNLAKSFDFDVNPTNMSSDGYPVTTPSINLLARSSPSMPDGYYGNFVWQWSGQGSMQILAAPPFIVNSGGVPLIGSASGDSAGGNVAMISATNPSVNFAFGWNIQSISSNGSGLIRIGVKTGYLNNGGSTGLVVNIQGANANTGANGTWTITKIDAQTFDLQNSTFTNAQASAGGIAYYVAKNLSININNSGTFSNMDSLVWCEAANLTAINSGLYCDPVWIAYMQQLAGTPGGVGRSSSAWFRFMDACQAQTNFEGDISQRFPATWLSYGTRFCAGYLTSSSNAAITNTGGDAYTCADPSVSTLSGGAYIDNAVVQGVLSANNTGGNPTLAVGSGPAKPIMDRYMNQIVLSFGGSLPTANQTMQFTFSATWLNSGSTVTINYVTSAGVTCTGNSSNTTNLTISAVTGTIFPGNVINGSGVPNQTTIVSQTSGPAGGAGVYVTSVATTCTNSAITINNDTASFNTLTLTVRSFVTAQLSGFPLVVVNYPPFGPTEFTILCRTSHLGALTITYASGPSSVSIVRILPAALTTSSNNATFVYNYLMDAWIWQGTMLSQSLPWEVAIEICNRVNVNCWWNWNINKGAIITGVVNYFAIHLNSGLKFGAETGNEIWNGGAQPFAAYYSLGYSLGFVSGAPQYSYCALRLIQYAALAQSAWSSAGQPASNLYIFNMAQIGENIGQTFDIYQLKGTDLTTSNAIYAAYGGLNGSGSAPSYTATGSRPVDVSTAIGIAPYWGSPWQGDNYTNLSGSVSVNAPLLQAANNFALGNTATAFSSLTNQFNGTTTGGTSGAETPAQMVTTFYPHMEAICAEYDSYRIGAALPKLARFDYEGGPQFSLASNPVNGLNSVNCLAASLNSGDISSLAGQMVGLGWGTSSPNLGAYTLTGTPTVSSGTYNSGTGQVVLTLSSAIADFGATDTVVMSLTGTGSVASLNGSFTAAVTGGGITVTYTAGTGLTLTISGGTVLDITAGATELSIMVLTMTQGWKFDTDHNANAVNTSSYSNMINANLYQGLATVSGSNREIHPGQYTNIGPAQWGLFASSYQAGLTYQNFDAIQAFNT